jgi:hypothetical protein
MYEDGDHSRTYSAWASSGERSSRTNASDPQEETTRPAALTLRLQQKKFDRFRQVFNYERPHEGLNNATPGSIYQPSSMTLPRNLIEYVYAKGFELRRVNNSGDISWHKGTYLPRLTLVGNGPNGVSDWQRHRCGDECIGGDNRPKI